MLSTTKAAEYVAITGLTKDDGYVYHRIACDVWPYQSEVTTDYADAVSYAIKAAHRPQDQEGEYQPLTTAVWRVAARIDRMDWTTWPEELRDGARECALEDDVEPDDVDATISAMPCDWMHGAAGMIGKCVVYCLSEDADLLCEPITPED